MAGAPSKYDIEKAKDVCELTATSSKSLKTICQELDLKVRTVLDWLAENNSENEFAQMYARAKQEQADFLAEEILDIADDGSNDLMTIVKGDISYEQENKEVTSRSKLRVDARKWVASKLKPKKYGDRIDLNHEGGQTIVVKFQDDSE